MYYFYHNFSYIDDKGPRAFLDSEKGKSSTYLVGLYLTGHPSLNQLFFLEKDSKKKQRNLQKLGIGGFLVRLRGPRFKDDDMDSLEGSLIEGEKPKRKPQKRKVKNKLMETFPSYLQVRSGFFICLFIH